MHQLVGTGWSNALYLRHQVCVEEQQQFLAGLVDRFNLTFPLTVDFSGSKYWLNGKGPYQCGEASTAFLAGANSHEASGNTSQLTQELEAVLKAFGSHLSPFSEERKSTAVGVLTAIFSGGPQPEQKIFDSGIMRSKTF